MKLLDKAKFEAHTGITRFQFFEYISKCLVGVTMVMVFFIIFPQLHDSLYWVIISLMLSITHNNSSKAAIDRMKANTIGPIIGLASYFFRTFLLYSCHLRPAFSLLASILSGVIVVIVFCTSLKIVTIARMALVGFFIVMIYEDDHHSWQGAIMRVVSVIIGCVIGLIINKIFAWISGKMRQLTASEKAEDEDPGGE